MYQKKKYITTRIIPLKTTQLQLIGLFFLLMMINM